MPTLAFLPDRARHAQWALLPLLLVVVTASVADAALPPPSDAAKAAAAEAAAKAAWTDKVAAYKLCQAQDRVAARYRESATAAGKPAPQPISTPQCVDPGPYASAPTPQTSKPLEASEAHSPAGTATTPPSTNMHDAELKGGIKQK
jgi:hypothetical protein